MQQHRVDEMANTLPKRAWKRVSAGRGARGERLYDWALTPWAVGEGWEHALLVRRSLEAEPEYAFYFAYARKEQSTLKTLVAVAGQRWGWKVLFKSPKAARLASGEFQAVERSHTPSRQFTMAPHHRRGAGDS